MSIGVKIVDNDYVEYSAVIKKDDNVWTAENLNHLAMKIKEHPGQMMDFGFGIDANGTPCLKVVFPNTLKE
jgi:hypothetical protein